MQRNAGAPLLIGVLVVIAIVAGLTVTGGPNAARAEKRDMARLGDLRQLRGFVMCLNDVNKGLPQSLGSDEQCGDDPQFNDPISNVPYGYKKLSDTSYRLCAGFERRNLIRDYDLAPGRWQEDSGCFVVTIP